MDELDEELEHQEFLDTLARLEERIFLALLMNYRTPIDIKYNWNDIVTFGDEPVFMALLFDKLTEEANNDESR